MRIRHGTFLLLSSLTALPSFAAKPTTPPSSPPAPTEPSSPVAAAAPAAPTNRISSPVSFYDDASIVAPGGMGISVGAGYGRVSAGHDLGLPSIDISVGINRRLELDASTGFAHSQFENFRISGLSDSYFGGKVLLVTEAPGRPAIAAKAMVEVLGEPSVANNLLAPKRVNFMAPVEFEKSSSWSRTYFTAGYNTRGIFFQSLGNELNVWTRFTPAVIVSYSRLTRDLGLVSDLGLNRSRLDVLGSASVAFKSGWNMFLSGGRSLGRRDPNSLTYQFSGGFSYNFRLWRRS